MMIPFHKIAAAFLLAALFGGCATHRTSTSSSAPTVQAPAALLKVARHTKGIEERLGGLFAAAEAAAKQYEKAGAEQDRLTYNKACAEFAVAWFEEGRELQSIQTRQGNIPFAASDDTRKGQWQAGYFTELLPPAELKEQSLVQQTPLDGFGGFLVGVHLPKDPRAKLLPRNGIPVPVTAVLSFSGNGNSRKANLNLYNPDTTKKALVAGRERILAADFSAPFGFYANSGSQGFLAMLRPAKYQMAEGIYLVQPYDPNKIPLVFVHGLMSVPQMWLPVMAAIDSDPALRGKFQFWAFDYPTGDPIAYMALELRRALAQVYEVYPNTPDMVNINHSLGGVITHLQVIDSGTALVDIFGDYAPKIMAMPDETLLKEALVFEANPRIDEVIFIAAPHRGAPMATSWLGNLGEKLIKTPASLLKAVGQDALKAAMATAGMKKEFVPNSINALSPDSPLLKAMNTREIKVPFHSIIGVAGKPLSPLEKTSDTVVPYWSSHLKAAESEKIVYATHETVFAKPEAIEEMKRILSLYLKEKRHKVLELIR